MEFNTAVPIYLQVIEDIKKKIVTNELQLGEQLPSVRELALQYQINPNTASRIYKEMEIQGICFTKRGMGTFITDFQSAKEDMRAEMALDYVNKFIHDMQGLGYNQEEMMTQIKEEMMKEDKKDAGK